jgi:formyltetrahydrofolate deformylase
MAIFVSKMDHCLNELLWLWKSGDIEAKIPLIISNHNNLKNIADFYNIPFLHIPAKVEEKANYNVIYSKVEEKANYNVIYSKVVPENNKKNHEDEILLFLKKEKIDFIILARYMQVLSPYFLKSFNKKIINIHHSFLPSFPGAKPYERAFEKGVKIIGATAHFVNEKLDGGSIIEQDIIRVNHDDNIDIIKRKGKIIEKIVLSRAVKWFVEDRIIEKDNKTIVFT